MVQYEIKDVVCDYGIYEDGKLKLILNSAHNAHLVKRILEIDQSVPNVATPADFVEVCRCKDCKRCDKYSPVKPIDEEATDAYFCKVWERYTEPANFCSYGERKEK